MALSIGRWIAVGVVSLSALHQSAVGTRNSAKQIERSKDLHYHGSNPRLLASSVTARL